ncbi:MAG: T9SS type A sorting domain-containing protein [Bacteroidales bacterium]|nr:T9SS type A sorting domain-containing protein [Bacteroidales bacterium]
MFLTDTGRLTSSTTDPYYQNNFRTRPVWGGFFPIISPYEELGTHMDARMMNFHIDRITEEGPIFAWNTYAMSPYCMDEELLYEVQYAPYGTDDWTTLSTTDSTLSIAADFAPGRTYQARGRVYRHHICPMHDTLVWGEWSRLILFHVGSTPPDTTVGIEPIEAASTEAIFTLSPNPTTGKVTVKVGHTPQSLRDSSPNLGEQLIAVRDAAGHEVLRQAAPAGQETIVLNLSSLPAGTYFVTVTIGGQTGTQRLLLQ